MGARSSQSRGPGLNETDGHLLEYFRNTFGAGGGGNSGPNVPIPTPGITATGGVISDYTSGSDIYRAHVFNSSGIFDVSALSQNPSIPDTVEYLVIAGGGAGGGTSSAGGGRGAGGAGGLRTNLTGHPLAGAALPVSTSPGEYIVTIGAGGAQAAQANGNKGTNSSFGPITSEGGGAGGYSVGSNQNDGGSGGSDYQSGTPNVGLGNTPPTSPPQGNNSGQGGDQCSGGGGGAGAVGTNGTSTAGGAGGAGVQVAIAGPTATTFTGVGAKNPSNNQYQYFAGGGGGGGYPSPAYQAAGGQGGGGAGGYAPDQNGKHGEVGTGGGGGGADGNAPKGGSGGSGIVIVRYKLGVVAGTAKATGGAISFYSNKTIHTFTNSGTFATAPNWSAADVEYVVIGGGGAGGSNAGTGGGAGAYRTGSTPIGAHPVSTSIQVGAGGVGNPTVGGTTNGTGSYFGSPITSPGGGKGTTNGAGNEGGSGGGGNTGGNGTGDTFPGTIGATPANGWGNNGGNQSGSGADRVGGGGGGAGAVGSNAGPAEGGDGGAGVQIPSTFRNPASSVGGAGPTSAPIPNGFDTSGKYWVAGGGGGSSHYPGPNPGGTGGGAPPSISPYNTSWSGGGAGGKGNYPNYTDPNRFASNGEGGTGGGGGSSAGGGGDPGGFGGSGLVLIAYPS